MSPWRSVTTDDEDFRVGTFHHLRSGFGYGSENRAQPPSRFARRLPSGTPEHRETVVGRRRFSAWHPRAVLLGGRPARIAVAGVARRAVRRRGVASAPFLRVRNPKKGLSLAATTPSSMRQGSFRFAADCGYFSRSKRSISPRSTLPYIEASSAIAGEIYSTVSATACWPPSPRIR